MTLKNINLDLDPENMTFDADPNKKNRTFYVDPNPETGPMI
jgi:hypothetical protein